MPESVMKGFKMREILRSKLVLGCALMVSLAVSAPMPVIAQAVGASTDINTDKPYINTDDRLKEKIQDEQKKLKRLEEDYKTLMDLVPKKGEASDDLKKKVLDKREEIRTSQDTIDQYGKELDQGLPAGVPPQYRPYTPDSPSSDKPAEEGDQGSGGYSQPFSPKPTPGWEGDEEQEDSKQSREPSLRDLPSGTKLNLDANEFLKPEFDSKTRVSDYKEVFDQLKESDSEQKIYVVSEGRRITDVVDFQVMENGSLVRISYRDSSGRIQQKVVSSQSIQDMGSMQSKTKIKWGE
jgi:hypothetical protein